LRALVLLTTALASMAQVQVGPPLLLARQAYNEGRFDAAIEAAEAALDQPESANEAALVLARARLERYRGPTGVLADIDAAHEALKSVDASQLDDRDYVEYLIGLGEALYFSVPSQFGGAAEFFEIALARSDQLEPRARDVVFEWWAAALDRLAQLGPESDRKAVYQRLLAGAERERARDDTSAVAWYWLAVSARGVDDIDRAWGAAVAAWIRSFDLADQGTKLRTDLDRLVTQVILPERAIRLSPGDARSELPIQESQWEEIKQRWGRRP
jgi:tetratricopeptide (TPR) repeat protein